MTAKPTKTTIATLTGAMYASLIHKRATEIGCIVIDCGHKIMGSPAPARVTINRKPPARKPVVE